MAVVLAGVCGPRAHGQTTTAESKTPQDESCAVPGLVGQSRQQMQEETLAAAYAAQSDLVKSLEATVIARAKAGAEYKTQSQDSRPSPVMIEFHAPAFLRMTGVIPFSAQRTFDMSSDGRDFRLLVPDGKLMRFFVGPVDAPVTSSNPRENLRPQPVVDALHWPAGKLRKAEGRGSARQTATREITLDLPPSEQSTGRTAIVQFDLDRSVVSQLTINDNMGRTLTQIQYADWQNIAQQSGGTERSCFPRRMMIMEPRRDLQLEMKVMSIRLNPPIPPQKFRILAPRGTPITRLSPPEQKVDR